MKSIKSNDPRIDVRIVDTEIKPWSMSITGMAIFDPSNSALQNEQTEFLKSISQYSIDNPPIIHKGSMVVRNQNDLDKIKMLSGFNATQSMVQKFPQMSESEVVGMMKDLEEGLQDGNMTQQTEMLFKKFGIQNKNMQGGSSIFSAPEKDFKVNEGLNYKDILSWRER